jgi:hypothetical protein
MIRQALKPITPAVRAEAKKRRMVRPHSIGCPGISATKVHVTAKDNFRRGQELIDVTLVDQATAFAAHALLPKPSRLCASEWLVPNKEPRGRFCHLGRRSSGPLTSAPGNGDRSPLTEASHYSRIPAGACVI